MAKKPDYLIIGTMKGGTTALNDFICTHPQVIAARCKEIHYFSLFPYQNQQWYLDHFPDQAGLLVGEASPTYFDIAYSQAIPQLIYHFHPHIKLILIVREPIARAVSHFFHLQRINQIAALADMDINTFFNQSYAAMLRQTTAVEFYLHQTINFSLYARKLLAYRGVFKPNQLLVIANESLKTDPQRVMQRVFQHLELDPYWDDSFTQFKYSSGQTVDILTPSVRDHLHALFDDDFSYFQQLAQPI
jgi:hypothetical protein